MDPQDQVELKYSTSNEAGGLELCVVCADRASGRHYGAISCEGCKGFFKRSIRKKLGYQCRGSMTCEVTKHHRNRCQYCRLQKCLSCGMRSDSVQHERKPIIEKVKAERDVQERQAAYSKLLGLANHAQSQVNPKEEANEAFAAVSPAGPALNLAIAAAVAYNKRKHAVSPYLASAPNELEGARRQQLMLQTQLANNLFKMGQFGAINEYLQTAYVALPPEVQMHAADAQQTEDEDPGILNNPTSLELPLSIPGSGSPSLRLHAACEAAARLLGALARWVLSINAVTSLPFDAQVTLLRKSWAELFVLGLCRWAQPLGLDSLLPLMSTHLHTELRERTENRGGNQSSGEVASPEISISDYTDERIAEISTMLCRLHQVVNGMHQLRISEREHAHLRALCLFSADGMPDFLTRKLQDNQMKVLRSLRSICDEERALTLVLQLSVFRSFTPTFIEDVFFVGFVGDVSIDEVIPYLLNAER